MTDNDDAIHDALLEERQEDWMAANRGERRCRTCAGTGNGGYCPSCRGTGFVPLFGLDSFARAHAFSIDHGDAVELARTFCASGYAAGAHGSTCPCDPCTNRAVTLLAYRRTIETFTKVMTEQMLPAMITFGRKLGEVARSWSTMIERLEASGTITVRRKRLRHGRVRTRIVWHHPVPARPWKVGR